MRGCDRRRKTNGGSEYKVVLWERAKGMKLMKVVADRSCRGSLLIVSHLKIFASVKLATLPQPRPLASLVRPVPT